MSIDVVAPTGPALTRIRSLAPLRRGDVIEARILDLVVHRGQVVETAPGIGALWLRKDATGERKLIYLEEYSVWLVLNP